MSRTLIERHRLAFPGSGFISVSGERMSDRDECRLWDMLWRIIAARHRPTYDYLPCDVFHEHPIANLERPRREARKAARKLTSWYKGVRGPHDTFADV